MYLCILSINSIENILFFGVIVGESNIQFLLNKLFAGGIESILVIALVIIAGLLYERHRLVKLLNKKDEKLDQIIDDYHKGNITIADAFNSVRLVLYEIKAKL